MNTNELADDWIEIADDNQIATMSVDELVNYLNGWYSTAAPRKAATMLRQLQAENEELKHMNKNWQISEGMALQEIELAKEFLKANKLYFSYVVWRHTK